MKALFGKPKKPGPPPGMVTIDTARDNASRMDELRRRQGSGADIVTGPTGAEAGSGAATLLG